MPSRRTPQEQIMLAARLYHNGIVCPAVCWRQTVAVTENASLTELLNSLTPADQAFLRSVHDERPGSLAALAENYKEPRFRELLEWIGETEKEQ